jgi:hypothetical protein
MGAMMRMKIEESIEHITRYKIQDTRYKIQDTRYKIHHQFPFGGQLVR